MRPAGIDRAFLPSGARSQDIETVLSEWGFESLDPSRRPWLSAIRELALSNRPERARALLEEWEQLVPTNAEASSVLEDKTISEAFVLAAEGKPEEGVQLLFNVQRSRDCARCELIWIAPMLEQAGRDQEAAEAWESVLADPIDTGFDDWWPRNQTQALLHLGPLYERLGETENAADAYQTLADAWTDADPELQPVVDEARAKAEALLSGDGP